MRNINDENFEETGFCCVVSIISGKYKLQILYSLAEFGTVRFNEMKRYLKKISSKTLNAALKELENDKLIRRQEYHEKVRRVEYSLTEPGKTLIPILDKLCDWGEFYKKTF